MTRCCHSKSTTYYGDSHVKPNSGCALSNTDSLHRNVPPSCECHDRDNAPMLTSVKPYADTGPTLVPSIRDQAALHNKAAVDAHQRSHGSYHDVALAHTRTATHRSTSSTAHPLGPMKAASLPVCQTTTPSMPPVAFQASEMKPSTDAQAIHNMSLSGNAFRGANNMDSEGAPGSVKSLHYNRAMAKVGDRSCSYFT